MSDSTDAVLAALRAARPEDDTTSRLATVTAMSSTNGVTVQFDGETSASAKLYQLVGACSVGDRVTMLRVGSTWVVLGSVRPASGTTALVTAGPNVSLGSTRVHARGGFAELTIENMTATAALAGGAILCGVPAGYLPASLGLARGLIHNFTASQIPLVQMLANGQLQTAHAIGSGNALYGSLVWPLP